MLDWLIQQTGRVFHFQADGRGELPKSVKSHAMIAKHMGLEAQRLERYAEAELAAGHPETAMRFAWEAAFQYGRAQHPLFQLDDEKRFLYDGVRRTYDRVIELAPYRIERLEIPWEGTVVEGLLHLNPNVEGPAPLLFWICGCDAFKESFPHPHDNLGHQRGFHVFSFEGPGQPSSNLRGTVLTADNYERAASTALDALLERPEVDPQRVVLFANSFGSQWGMQFAAHDPRLAAVAATQISICPKWIHMDLESPRWKQLMAFLTRAANEAELDRIMAAMSMEGRLADITVPLLWTVGEYDPRSPLSEVYPLFDQLTSPSELWVLTDQHHNVTYGDKSGGAWGRANFSTAIDWLRDRLEGRPQPHAGQVRFVPGGSGPNSPAAKPRRAWFEDA